MIKLKTREEIAVMKEGGKILIDVANEIIPRINPGMTTKMIDDEAERLIKKKGALPSFQTVKGYKWATCLPVNEQAVHTPPSDRVLRDGDIITLDVGVLYKGFHTDYAYTKAVGKGHDPSIIRFLDTGRETLDKAIAMVKNGEYLGTIAKFIQNEIEGHGYFILKDLTGHGIGRELHEDPYVLNYVDRPVSQTYRIKPGFVMALEIIYSMGSEKISYEKDNSWSIISADKSLSACFEKTIAINQEKGFILT